MVAERLQQALREDVEDQETRRQRLRTLRDYHRKIERFGAGAAEEERQQQILEAEDLARQLAVVEREVRREARSLTRTTSVVEALDELVAMAGEAIGEDPKLQQLVAESRTSGGWSPRPTSSSTPSTSTASAPPPAP